MSTVRNLHRQAMELAEAAALARLEGKANADELLRQAYQREEEAAGLTAADLAYEPTRSVLHRSAAALALNCGLFREAERLIATGLAGDPPPEVADELRDLLEQVYFERHLSLRGLALAPDELQLSIVGTSVGFGMVLMDEFVGRVRAFEKLVFRTAERLLGIPYRESGGPARDVRESIEVVMSVPKAGSFAVSLRMAQPHGQRQLPGFEVTLSPTDVVDEVVKGLAALNTSDEVGLQGRISQTAYYRNFVGLARQLVPDGRQVSLVGLTLIRDGASHQVRLTRTRDQIAAAPKRPAEQPVARTRVTVRGTLRFADATRGTSGIIKLVEDQGTEHIVEVPEGLMADIVRPLWDNLVVVEGYSVGNTIQLEDIKEAEA